MRSRSGKTTSSRIGGGSSSTGKATATKTTATKTTASTVTTIASEKTQQCIIIGGGNPWGHERQTQKMDGEADEQKEKEEKEQQRFG